MRNKSKPAEQFIDGLILHIEGHVLRQKENLGKREREIQRGLYPLIVDYVADYYKRAGYKDYLGKAAQEVYWEGQDTPNAEQKVSVFAARSYPDFIIRSPYRIAIEYKQSPSGALVKQCIGQGLMYIMSEDYDFAYLLFDDQSKDKKIRAALTNPREHSIRERMWRDFNMKMQIL